MQMYGLVSSSAVQNPMAGEHSGEPCGSIKANNFVTS
jgi:hypothetical protein